MLQTYYLPYPILTDLRGSTLGQAGASLSLPTQQALDKVTPADPRKLAKRLKMSLPKIPAGAADTPKRQEAWTILERIDVTAELLAQSYQMILRLLALGAVACEDLNLYNRAALDIYDAQQGAVEAMHALNVMGAPTSAPPPTLFVGYGAYAGAQRGEINCTPGAVVVQSSANGVQPSPGCPVPGLEGWAGLGAGPLIVVGVAAAIALGVYFIADAWRDIALDRQRAERGQIMAEYLHTRLKALTEYIEICRQQGLDVQECIKTFDKVTTPQSLVDAMEQNREDRGLFWWLGLGVFLVGAGIAGGVYWSRRASR